MTNIDLILNTTSETSRTARVPKSEVDLAGLASARRYSRTPVIPERALSNQRSRGQLLLFLDSVANGATARSSSCRCHAMAQSQSKGTCRKRANLMSSCRFLAFRPALAGF